eukprot:538410-Hanusia_phi.AAC.1
MIKRKLGRKGKDSVQPGGDEGEREGGAGGEGAREGGRERRGVEEEEEKGEELITLSCARGQEVLLLPVASRCPGHDNVRRKRREGQGWESGAGGGITGLGGGQEDD